MYIAKLFRGFWLEIILLCCCVDPFVSDRLHANRSKTIHISSYDSFVDVLASDETSAAIDVAAGVAPLRCLCASTAAEGWVWAH